MIKAVGDKTIMANITWSFDSAVRGYHFYRKFWTPYLSQKLSCDHESENAFDRFAIKMSIEENGNEKIVGHLPREISRPTKFLLARGAIMHAEISSEKYRPSPLVQGGLELLCVVYVSMPPTVLNENLISRYKSLVGSLYVEPSKGAEIGSFLENNTNNVPSVTTANEKRGTTTNIPTKSKKRKTTNSVTAKTPEKQRVVQSKNIRSFFPSTTVVKSTKPSKPKNVVIDLTD